MMTRHVTVILAFGLMVLAMAGYPFVAMGSEKGTYRVYGFDYRDNNTTTLFPERLGQQKSGGTTFMSSFAFDGDLVVRDYGDLDGTSFAGLSFQDIRSNRFVLNGHDIFEKPSDFIEAYKNKEVLVSLNESREITAFYFPKDTTQLFKTFMTMVAQEIQVSTGEGDSWERTEFNQHGKGRVTYKKTGTAGGKTRVKKTLTRYDYPGLIEPDDLQDITMDNDITLDQAGMVETIHKEETTRIKAKNSGSTVMDVKKTVSLTKMAEGMFDSAGLSRDFLGGMQAVSPGEFITDEGQERDLLAKQASFLSYDEIERWIGVFKPDIKDNRANNAMFYRTTGFVELHPQSMDKLADYARTKAKTSREKTLVMNILAAVGNRNAQKAMRDILRDPAIQKERQYGILIQNFSFVDEKPEPETLDYLQDLMMNKKGFASYSAAHAYGAMIHTLYTQDEKDRALSLNQPLLHKMESAGDVTDKAEYVAALGNAGMIENNPHIINLFQDPSPKIRSEAAMALRKTETPESRKVLISVFTDEERSVQRSAIQTCLQYKPEKTDLETIRSQLDKELIQEANYYDLVNLLTKNKAAYPDLTRQCLKLMVRKKLEDPDLEARIRGLIQ